MKRLALYIYCHRLHCIEKCTDVSIVRWVAMRFGIDVVDDGTSIPTEENDVDGEVQEEDQSIDNNMDEEASVNLNKNKEDACIHGQIG